MSSRERNLAVLLIGLILLGVGGAGGYLFAYEPIREKRAAAARLEQEIADLDGKLDQARKDLPRLAEARRRSLPPDPALARREYGEMMSRLLVKANVPLGFRVTERPTDAAGIPLLAAKQPAYTRVVYEVAFEKADMWAVHDFLTAYYGLGLLHQITALEIRTDAGHGAPGARKATADRKDLSVRLTTEAIVLDGAEPRRSLLPVSTAFAAAGGLAGYDAIALVPEAGRGLTPLRITPVLATPARDYTLLVQNDMFHGPLPSAPPLRVETIADLAVEAEKPIPPVKVPLAGDLGPSGRVTLDVRTEGRLFPDGSVKVDQAARTISLTPAKGETGTATVIVTAKAEGGPEAQAKFKVTVGPADAAGRPDISDAVRLVIATTRSDGSAVAVVRDNFNPFNYEIEADPKGVRVTKYAFRGRRKEAEKADGPADQLVISDQKVSATYRQFKVVAVAEDGLVLIDLKPPAPTPKDGPRPWGPPPGGFPPDGPPPAGFPPGPPSGGPPRRGPRERTGFGPAEALALAVGAAAAQGQTAPADQPTLYRWAVGKSLRGLTEVPKDKARKILRRVAETGPVGAAVVAAGN